MSFGAVPLVHMLESLVRSRTFVKLWKCHLERFLSSICSKALYVPALSSSSGNVIWSVSTRPYARKPCTFPHFRQALEMSFGVFRLVHMLESLVRSRTFVKLWKCHLECF